MKIVLDCPGCGKRYEVDASLAGKRSRCKDCGDTFRIPDAPGASSVGESKSGRDSATGRQQAAAGSPRESAPAVYAEIVSVPASAPIIASGAARGTVVFNCPRCFKRYEVDASLSGKKSRCKDCKEVFTIPSPMNAPEPAPVEQAPPAKKSSLSGRNFTVIPEEVVPDVAEQFVFEPDDAVRRAPPPRVDEEPMELIPRRTTYPKQGTRRSRRENVDTEFGVTVAGAYVALGILAFIILAIWHAAGDPGAEKVGRVFRASLLILMVLGILMANWASIWLLVIAFRDKIEQGLFCLFVPLYPLYYILSRWRETRGIFAMSVAPFLMLLLFLLFGGFVLGLSGPTAFVNALLDRVESLAPDLNERSNPNKQAVATRVYRDCIQAMNRYAEEMARIEPSPNLGEVQRRLIATAIVADQFYDALRLAKAVKLNPVDAIAVKKSVGDEMRAAIIALKYQFSRLQSLPRFPAGAFAQMLTELDQMLTAWEATIDGSTGDQTANLFPLTIPEGHFVQDGMAPGGMEPGGMLPGGMPPGRMPRGVPPGGMRPRFETFEAHFERMRGQYGDRAVMVVLVGLPTNSDPAVGVTKRDVEVAIDNRLKALAPEGSQSMSSGSGGDRSICLISVEDVKRLAESIDFGKASRNGSRIDVVVSREYIASVPRLPATAQPSIAARPHNPRDDEPKVPANADSLTKALAQLQSSEVGRKKDALNQIRQSRPTARLKEVHDAVLPLLEHDDEDLIKHAVRVLAVWQSPAAMAKLIDMVSDSRVFLRWDVIKSLGKYDDVKAAEALIDRLEEDGHIVEGEAQKAWARSPSRP